MTDSASEPSVADEIEILIKKLYDRTPTEEEYSEPQFRDGPGPLLPDLSHTRINFDAVAERAAYRLGRLGPDAQGAIPHLIKRLRDPRSGAPLRRKIVKALSEVGGSKEDIVRALSRAVREDEPIVTEVAIEALSKASPNVFAARIISRRIQKWRSIAERNAGLKALKAMSIADREVIRCLLQSLSEGPDRRAPCHELVAQLFIQMRNRRTFLDVFLNPSRRKVLKTLVYAFCNPRKGLSRERDYDLAACLRAFKTLGPPATRVQLGIMVGALLEKDQEVRNTAKDALVLIGDQAVPVLLRGADRWDAELGRGGAWNSGRLVEAERLARAAVKEISGRP